MPWVEAHFKELKIVNLTEAFRLVNLCGRITPHLVQETNLFQQLGFLLMGFAPGIIITINLTIISTVIIINIIFIIQVQSGVDLVTMQRTIHISVLPGEQTVVAGTMTFAL